MILEKPAVRLERNVLYTWRTYVVLAVAGACIFWIGTMLPHGINHKLTAGSILLMFFAVQYEVTRFFVRRTTIECEQRLQELEARLSKLGEQQ